MNETFEAAWQRVISGPHKRDVAAIEIMGAIIDPFPVPWRLTGASGREIDLEDATLADFTASLNRDALVISEAHTRGEYAPNDVAGRYLGMRNALIYLGPQFHGPITIRDFLRASQDDLLRPNRG